MDKSVFTDASAFNGIIGKHGADSFLVALSTMAANMTVTGMSHVPTDSILVLDISGSMNDGDNDVAEELVQAANASIKALPETNIYNRVGVVLYSGASASTTNHNAAVVLLPLNRYTTAADDRYLTYTKTSAGWGSTTETVGLDQDVRVEGTDTTPNSVSKEVVGATYIQKGIIAAMNQFVAEDNDTVVNDPRVGALNRKPVLVLMSDGAPTLGSTNFTDPGQYELGTGSDTSAALGFVSQLSAAYAKAKIEEKYATDALFYTLGLGIGDDRIAISVMDPDNASASTAVDDFWNDIQRTWGGRITFEGYNHLDAGEEVDLGGNLSVTKIETPLEQNYVDRYFAADGSSGDLAAELVQAFADIVSDIQLQSSYFPTLITGNEELSGYVSFVDRVGRYMEVTDVKGILLHQQLFSGSNLASNFVPGGGALGTYENPTELGMEMVAAVRDRLGLSSDDTARTLIAMAYENGQLSYTDENHFSNYIGWYANAAGQFLGFYQEGVTELPAATGNAATDPAFLVKSYGYLGEVDASHGVSESDMMYATVQVRESIATGEQLVTFAVPAALIPVVTYHVTLDENHALSDLTVSGAQHPIRLVYEVALQADISSYNVREKVSAEYLAENLNADGSVNFYTNQWDHDNTIGYGTVNTYGYFNPSRQNDKYYYLEDAPVYSNTNGTLYTGQNQPSENDTLYRTYRVYKNNGNLEEELVYRALSTEAKATAVRKEDGTWYIPKGNVHVNMDGYAVHKEENRSGTLSEASIPFVDTHNHSVNDAGYQFYVGATLGNNGKLTVMPETGIRLSKTMAQDAAVPSDAFTFTITNLSDETDSKAYPAWLRRADGSSETLEVQLANGKASVELSAGDVLYIGGMTAGETFRITEQETAAYVANVSGLTAEGTVTVSASSMQPVDFVNSNRGTGHLTVAKEVAHDYGVDYQIPADRVFTMEVTLKGIGTANATFRAAHSNGGYTQIATDAEGRFTVQLRHDEQFEVFDLPAGTEAVVVETNYGDGFTPTYWDNDVQGDGSVTVLKDTTVSVVVTNAYEAAEVYPVYITVSGSKILTGRDWQAGDSFQFVLQKLVSANPETWQQLGDVVNAVPGAADFQFDNAFRQERYESAGIYYYRVIELEPEVPLGGMIYDKTVHSFAVVVADRDMDGKLEIVEVRTDRPDTTAVTGDAINGWNVSAQFTNTYSAAGSATVTVDVNKVIENLGGAKQSLAGYTFGLFDSLSGEQVGQSLTTTERGFARFVLNYNADQAGQTYTYILKEIAPNSVPDGWTYSTEEILITVEVLDNGNGTISAVIYTGQEKPVDAGTSISTVFTNYYDPKDTSLDISFVEKQLSGRPFGENDSFTFEIVETHVPEGVVAYPGIAGKTTADADGDGLVAVVFDAALSFDAIGTYYFQIRETSPSGNGITKDPTVYSLIVTVTDIGGQLSASYVLVNTVGDTITFHNIYTAEPVSHSITGRKELDGKTLLNDEFTFVLTQSSINGAAVEQPISWTATNLSAQQDGSFTFPQILYTQAGSYTYLVTEQRPESSKAYGILFDDTSYLVTVEVVDDLQGGLKIASETVTEVNGGEDPVELVFRNVYQPASTSTQFGGNKELVGKVLGDLRFAFRLYDADANWSYSEETLREIAVNDENGIFQFRSIDFANAGEQYFVVLEEHGGDTIDGITYDNTVYHIRVEITDDQKGNLNAKVHIYDAAGVPKENILFVNHYQVSQDAAATVTLGGEKTLDGRDWTANDRFTFELLNAVGSAIQTETVNSENRSFSMTLGYTAADVGQSYTYILREVNGGQIIGGVAYDETQYTITVEVMDNGDGTIRAEASVAGTTALNSLNFTNRYAEEITVYVDVEKTVEFRSEERIALSGFRFQLVNLENPEDIYISASDRNGDARFALTFTQEDVGKTFTFDLSEIDDGQNFVEYSTEDYRISVKITLSEEGRIRAKLAVDDEAVEQIVAEFVNIYAPPGMPQTGDQSHLGLWILLLAISSGAALMMLLLDRKQRKAA